MKRFILVMTLLLAPVVAPAVADIPPRPEDLQFQPLDFSPPKAKNFRHALEGGVSVYMYPSHEFPLINVSFTFKGGAYLDPSDKIGLAGAMGTMMRRGGTAAIAGSEFDEELAFLAANVSSSAGDTQSSATLNCLKSNFAQSFTLFMDMVRNPGFDMERFEIFKDETIESMKQRNDFAGAILGREFSALMYGSDHFQAANSTEAIIRSFTKEDLRAIHGAIFHPGNLIIAVTGDFNPREMLATLEGAFHGWEAGDEADDPPAPTAIIRPGVYHVAKDIPQGKVAIGMRSIQREDPLFYAAQVMSHILGSGGFTSRITKRVRSDEGLAYSAGARLSAGVYYPGLFRASFESKNRTVALAIKIIFEEIDRIRDEQVSEEELDVAKNSFIETFPRTFESKAGTLGVFVSDELTKRDSTWWQSYRDRIRAVSVRDVQRCAEKLLQPDEMAIMIVGNWDEIESGDLEGRASMSDFFGGSVTHLPLRDPLTMEPIE